MFGRSDSSRAEPPAGDRERERAAASSPVGPAGTLVGPSARFVGEITGDEDVAVQGRVEGNIDVTRRVTVAPSGEVEGDVHGRTGRRRRRRAIALAITCRWLRPRAVASPEHSSSASESA